MSFKLARRFPDLTEYAELAPWLRELLSGLFS